jgi:uncharacterized protein YbaP (TraB family)
MFRLTLLIGLFFSSILGAQTTLKYPTLLWKISGNGLKKDSYLYGTMHVSNRVAYHLSDQFFDAIKSVDVVGLETNPAEWLANMELTGELSKASGVSLYNPYGGNFYKNVFGMRFPDRQVYKSILSFDPEIINGLLYRNTTSQENFEENTYIDLFIYQAAAKLNKKIVSLEDFVKAEIQAKLAALPDTEFNPDVKDENDYSYRYGANDKMEDAYRQGNLDAVDSLTKVMETKNMQQYLLHNRNGYFVHCIDSILRSGKALFSGVGAAHLPGGSGVIELLRKLNYKVEPVAPKQTGKAIKEQDNIDQILKPVSFEKNYAPDSLFSIQVPGKLIQIMNYDNIKYYINADMVNGNFYNVARLKTNSTLNNYTNAKMTAMLDSLFFENIPGKIISKKEIENNGIKGFDIINKTRRGDLQRYHIFINDLELIIFKLGGKGEFVNSTAGKQFFNSIKFETRNASTILYQPPTKGFKVRVPGELSYSRNDYVGVAGLVEDLSAYDKKEGNFFGVKHAIYNDFYYLEEDTFELNRLASYALQNFKFTKEISTELKKEQGFPCIYVNAKNTVGKKFCGKIFIKGVHYYLAYAISDNKVDLANDFFKSFELTEFNYLNEIKEIKDNELHFITKDETSNTATSRFNEQFAKVYNHIKDSLKTKKGKADDFDYTSNTKNYYSPSSHEYVEIFYEKYNDYDYRTKKDLVDKVKKNLGELLTMNIRMISQKEENGTMMLEFYMKDTATARAIKTKLFVRGGAVYQVKVPCDTTYGLKGWAAEFYNSFKLKDTTIGKDIFKNKFKSLLNDLVSADTAVARKAMFSISNSISLDKEYLDDFLQFLQSDKLNKISSDAKAQLFVSGGVFESEKIIPVYTKLYAQYADSAYLQICLLKGLAYYKNRNAFKAVGDLILKETPLVGDESVVGNVFKVLQDSLELCNVLYPSILTVTRNEEYHTPVYKLLSLLMKKKLVTAQQIALSKPDILQDANAELKRYNATSQGKGKATSYSINTPGAEDLINMVKDNLETLSQNAIVKNTKYKDVLNLNDQPLLVNFAYILMPYYKTDEKAKQFCDKVSRIKNEKITMPMYVLYKKNGMSLNDTLATYFAKNPNTRAYFYSELERDNLTQEFPKQYATQTQLVESVIKAYNLVNTYSAYDTEKPKDSLILYKEVKAHNKYEKGTIYIFRSQKNKMGLSKWSVAFVPTLPDNKINTDIVVLRSSDIFNETLSETEIENEILDDFAGVYRNRIVSSKSNYFDYE